MIRILDKYDDDLDIQHLETLQFSHTKCFYAINLNRLILNFI